MHRRTCLDASDVRLLMAAGRAEAERRGLPVALAVVDEAGVLLALERLDRARLHTPEAAWLKARTAAITRTSTQDLQDAIQANAALLAFPGRLPLTGGVPLRVGEEIVGGVGSSGGEPEDDLAVCHAVRAALGRLPLAG
ncbi:heme-binding protein [Methylobacterium sp. NEAU 140]|uniref:GlcG/HbpS family heme-binding protein n=1 Tax=Methylobacterium sp. NEAU 140 TaxID=3064945 RepID=UPI002736C8B8|nr:heme-binding protein [Methylobacterium sp. NEAU 140]MDP4021910.1 heme-binding protein [Methylobacterium sp. NEAU 140]